MKYSPGQWFDILFVYGSLVLAASFLVLIFVELSGV